MKAFLLVQEVKLTDEFSLDFFTDKKYVELLVKIISFKVVYFVLHFALYQYGFLNQSKT